MHKNILINSRVPFKKHYTILYVRFKKKSLENCQNKKRREN